MKKIAVVFMALLIVFCGIWIAKTMLPSSRPDDVKVTPDNPWYEGSVPTPDPDWVLDPTVPDNYIPVPGSINIFMIIDEDGNIVGYVERVKVSEDENGTKYEWKHIEDSIQSINPDIPENYEVVPGLENIYKVTNKDGSVSYFRYIRNDDGSYAFIPVDKDGKDIEADKPDNSGAAPANYIRIGETNIFAVYNEHGVCIGYKELTVDSQGNVKWINAKKPEETSSPTKPTTPQTTKPSINKPTIPVVTPTEPDETVPHATTPTKPTQPNGSTETNTYTQTQITTTSEIKGNWLIKYETKVTHVYSSDGKLLSTTQEGPYEVERVQITDDNNNTPDPSKIAKTLREEYARVSVGTTYMKDLAQEVLTILNTERVAAGLPALTMVETSDAYLLSAIKAADMAIFNHAEYDSPLYGTAIDLCDRFDIGVGSVSDYAIRTTSKGAGNIATRLSIALNGNFTTREYTSVGLSIVVKGTYYYVDLILFE